ncbi:hypothetical protein [Methylobacterium pseudosasicola]|uniref:Uncharacterized protein n=1 Tax=Methylobacterium pseudosasicola TaxID=582667 RepID=A0A1I4GTY0_9HYPH|nr:hypothetical protein [Methylobacterium pseudosasicola]SFL32970.1 hypothetical protein SAMN05192568_1003211 [Methylobacterium pseudosasicola]
MFDDASARRYLAGLAPVAPGSVRWLIYDEARHWVSVVDTEMASLRQDCAHVLSTLPEEDPNASLAEAIREFLAEGPDRTPHVIALSCAVLMQSTGDLDEVFARIQSGVMATFVDAEDVVVRPVAA